MSDANKVATVTFYKQATLEGDVCLSLTYVEA